MPVEIGYAEQRNKHFAEMRAAIPEHIARTRWPAERIRREQTNGLRRLLRVAKESSPWHRERLAGVDPEMFDPADLAGLPVMTKADLMANFDDIVTDRSVTAELVERHLAGLGDRDAYLLADYHAAVSGGSSGVRAIFAFDRESWTNCFLAMFRYLYRDNGPDPASRPPLIAGITAPHPAHISSALRQTFAPPEPFSLGLSILDPFDQTVDRLNQARPEVLFSYPSVLHPLALTAVTGGLTIAPRAVISVAEPLLPEVQAAIRRAWPRTRIYNWYVASEAGCAATGCGSVRGMHVNEDLVVLEPVHADGQPVRPGVRSDKLYVTNLSNRLLPLIRYEMDDQITPLPTEAPCPCGSAYRRIADVGGRQREVFRYPGGITVHPLRLSAPLTVDPAVLEYQVSQTHNGITVRLRGTNPDLANIHGRLKHALTDAGLPHPEVAVSTVDHLPRVSISGKLPRFIPLTP